VEVGSSSKLSLPTVSVIKQNTAVSKNTIDMMMVMVIVTVHSNHYSLTLRCYNKTAANFINSCFDFAVI